MSKCVDREGTKRWYKDGKLHREDGPAVEWLVGSKWWCKNGEFHREDGPAVEEADGGIEYWVNGIYLTEIEYFVKFGVANG